MNNKIIKELSLRFKEAEGNISIGDSDKCQQLGYFDTENDFMAIENMFVSIYNLLNTHDVRLEQNESDLRLLVSRVYNTDENFTTEEIEEIKSALDVMDSDDLENVKKDCDYLADNLFVDDDVKSIELMNKIKYPTKRMYDTFNELLNTAMQTK
jgi:hypothetical protein